MSKILLGVIAIAAIVFGFFYFSKNLGLPQANKNIITQPSATAIPTPSTAAKNWKTYTNIALNYSINYPSDWEVRESTDPKSGAAFRPANKPNDPQYEYISINKYTRVMFDDSPNLTFEEYVKKAGAEIQNYKDLATIKKVVTDSGLVGYTATWNVSSIVPGQKGGESTPRTYFEIPSNNLATIQVVVDDGKYLDIYNQMLATFKYGAIKQAISPTPSPDTKSAVSAVLAKKYNKPASEVKVTISKEVPGFASGSVSFGAGGPGEGGMWLAVLGNGWDVVWDGNGNVDCNKMRNTYGFPDTILKPNFCD